MQCSVFNTTTMLLFQFNFAAILCWYSKKQDPRSRVSRLSFGFLWLWSLRFEFFRTSPLKCKSKRNFYTSMTVPSAIIKSGIVSQMIHYDQNNAKVIMKICYFFFLIRFTAKIDYHYFMSSQILDFMCSKTVIEERRVNFLLILSKYQRRI